MDANRKQSCGGAVTVFRDTGPDSYRCDTAAAVKIFLDHKDFIREAICFHIQDKDQAEDLFQDFFLSFISSPLPTGIQNIESYLYKAVVNDIIDAAHRKEKYRDCMHEYAERSDQPRSQQTPPEAVLEKEEAGRVFDLIEKRLPPTEAQAVCLQYREGFSAKEIAQEMGVAIATVRGYVSEGLSRIRRSLSVRGKLRPRSV